MKKIVSIILCAALVAAMTAGCTVQQDNDPESNPGNSTSINTDPNDTQGTEDQQPEDDAPTKNQPIGFEYQRFEGQGHSDDDESLIIIRSLAELEAYCEDNAETIKADFTDAVAAYDSEFFTNHTMILVPLSDTCYHSYHEIKKVTLLPDGNFVVDLDWIWPEVNSPASNRWLILLEIDERITEDARVTLEINHLYVQGGVYEEPDDSTKEETLAFVSQRIETGGYQSYGANVIRSVAELDAYYMFDMASLKDSDFLNVTAGYDDSFFADHFLLVLPIGSETSSERQEVTQVIKQSDKCCYVYVDRIIPEVVTDESGHWHIIVEVEGYVAEHAAMVLDFNEIQESGK